ncbi:MAG: rhomboid family intramembrane serine protease [Luteibaculum sp.]
MNSQNLKLFTRAVIFPLLLVTVIWIIQIISFLEGYDFSFLGIYPLHFKGLLGILTSPFVHGDFAHASSNTVPLLFLGSALHFAYPKIAYRVWLYSALLGGFWVWLVARPSYHIGASGLIYALFGFLFVRGLISRQKRLMGLCLLVAFLYGGMVWGIFPVEQGVSWEGHMFGLMAGISLAFYFRHEYEYKKPKPWELIGEENYIREAEERFGERYWEGGNVSRDKDVPGIHIVYHYVGQKKSPQEDSKGD